MASQCPIMHTLKKIALFLKTLILFQIKKKITVAKTKNVKCTENICFYGISINLCFNCFKTYTSLQILFNGQYM